MDNANPTVFERAATRQFDEREFSEECLDDAFDAREVYDMIRGIRDPEHPFTLEQLHVLDEANVTVDDENSFVSVHFTPTITHCSAATLIGLSIIVKLMRSLPARFKLDVRITEGAHDTEHAINKQLNDKERVSAAIENPSLLRAINRCLIEE
jgi:metal-sulfur cluster biosynthetic enzyme